MTQPKLEPTDAKAPTFVETTADKLWASLNLNMNNEPTFAKAPTFVETTADKPAGKPEREKAR